MKIKRIFALLLAAVVVLSLAACGNKYVKEEYDLQTYYFGEDEYLENFPSVTIPLIPSTVYASLEYNEKMFYGTYQYDGLVSEDFSENATYMPLDYADWKNEPAKDMVSTVPFRIKAGPTSCDPGRKNREHEWAIVTFGTDEGRELDVTCTYTVSGDTITFTPVTHYEVQYEKYEEDGETYTRASGLVYELGTASISYTFSFRGLNLTLSNGSEKVVLQSGALRSNKKGTLGFSGTVDPSSPSLPDIDYISCSVDTKGFDPDSYASFTDDGYYGDEGYVYNYKKIAMFREDGLFTMAWSHDDEYGKEIQEVRQFVAFIGGYGSLILADHNAVYYYTMGDDSYLVETVSMGMTDAERLALEEMADAEVEAIVQKKADLLTDLSAAFQEAGLSVQINETTGEIALDSTVLFAVDKSDISAEGKEMLGKFMQVYTSVVFNDQYNGFVSRIMVEGHTDTDGTYELNQTLSQARADAVREFCLSAESGVDAAYQQQLAASLSAVGYSWDYPVYAADGTVDMAASRRVAFRFIINVNQ